MRDKLRTRRRTVGLLAVAVGAGFALLGAVSPSHAQQDMSPAIGRIGVRPEVVGPVRARPDSDVMPCQSRPIDGSAGARCYSPQQIQQAYGYAGLLASGVDGSGVTIAIVDAYSNPYVATDLAIQDAKFGLPGATFEAVAPQGVPTFDVNDPNMASWAQEITLDVLWAHAMAPGAKIVLVEAKSSQTADVLAATKWAVDNDAANVVSMSFGQSELCIDPTTLAQEHALFQEAVDKGITLFASSGDSGAEQWDCNGVSGLFSVGYPASDPLVTAVGGTTLDASDPAGDYLGETAWTEINKCNPPDQDDVNCSGGGYSLVYQRPDYQAGVVSNYRGRGVPDVSYDAGVNGGVLTHCAVCNILAGQSPTDSTLFVIFGGTSAGAPQWAGLTADAEQMAGHSLGNINPTLYELAAQPARYAADFHDVTTGSNRVALYRGDGYDAGSGWDAVTGLGTPNAANLLPVLQGPPVIASAPVVSGGAGVGQVLTTTKGEWHGSPTSYTYQWQRCDSAGGSCTDIAGATGYSLRLGAEDTGYEIRSEIVATNSLGPSTPAPSAPTAAVAAILVKTSAPTVSGRAVVGRKLRTTDGSWNTAPSSLAYAWLRCTPKGSRCRKIAGAASAMYKLASADSGHTIRVRISATNAAGTVAVLSTHSGVVVGMPKAKKKPRIAGRATVGYRLRARKGIWRGPPARYRYQWLRCDAHGYSCRPIAHARHVRYRVGAPDVGHRLRVRVTAFNVAGRGKVLSRPSPVVS